MPDKSQLGLYWGSDAFSIAEVKKTLPAKIAYVPFNTPLDIEEGEDLPEGLRMTALIQKGINDQQISSKKICLSVQTKDLIFRTFVIPWMQPDEVKSVVDFEATKYIPLPLEQLSYTYHASPFTENKEKNLRILFVAVRKDILEKYTGILEHSGFKVAHIEPDAVSLARLLHEQNHIIKNQTTAIFEIGKQSGKITVVSQEVVLFVREFPIQEEEALGQANSKLFNDARVSINFFSRQLPEGHINSIFVISTKNLGNLPGNLAKELNIPVSAMTTDKILKSEDITSLGPLYAAGIALRKKAFSTKNFDLSEEATQLLQENAGAINALATYKKLAAVVAGCILFVAASIFISNQMVANLKAKKTDLDLKQGKFSIQTRQQLDSLSKELEEKIANYKNIRIASNVSHLLLNIPHKLPEGAWLNSINITFITSWEGTAKEKKAINRVNLNMEGVIYRKDTTEQLRAVNELVANFRDDEELAKIFKEIKLENISQEEINSLTVISFRVKGM